jgi:3-oxoadipate enol-lactonase
MMKYTDVNGTGVRYELNGKGPKTIVLIHEMGGSLETWEQVVPKLGANYCVLRYDMRGCGMSEKITGELKIETLSNDLLCLLDLLGIAEPVYVAGCAVGAGVSICFAGMNPSRTKGLILFSPAVGIKVEQRPDRLKRIQGLEKRGMRAIADDSLAKSYPAVVRAVDPEVFSVFRARWLGNDPESFCAMYRMLINMDLGNHIRAVSCRTTVIGGVYDEVRPPVASEEVARQIPGAEFKIIQSGHQMPAQTPELVCDVINEFIESEN